jgi:hypothetical protein
MYLLSRPSKSQAVLAQLSEINTRVKTIVPTSIQIMPNKTICYHMVARVDGRQKLVRFENALSILIENASKLRDAHKGEEWAHGDLVV